MGPIKPFVKTETFFIFVKRDRDVQVIETDTMPDIHGYPTTMVGDDIMIVGPCQGRNPE